MTEKQVIILVAGGTGGHLFPAEALAAKLVEAGYDVHLATDERAKKYVHFFADDHVHIIPSATVKSKNPIALVKTLWQLMKGVRVSRKLFLRLRPILVGGFGGYPTVPPLYAANSFGIKTFIHEQNAVMGRANKVFAAKVQAIAGGFLAKQGPYADKIIITGNPMREKVIEAAKQSYKAAKGQEPFNFLVFGGSQGASYFAQVVPDAIKLLSKEQQKRLRLVQQTRGAPEKLIETYNEMGIDAKVAAFFDNMPEQIAKAHFIMARSGASTVAEIATIGRPALLVPYPHALDHDQAANAEKLAATGGVEVMKESNLDALTLANILNKALEDGKILAKKAKAAKEASHEFATERLAELVKALIIGKKPEELHEFALQPKNIKQLEELKQGETI